MQFGNWKEKLESDSKTLRWQVTRRTPLTNNSRKRAYASQPRVLRDMKKYVCLLHFAYHHFQI